MPTLQVYRQAASLMGHVSTFFKSRQATDRLLQYNLRGYVARLISRDQLVLLVQLLTSYNNTETEINFQILFTAIEVAIEQDNVAILVNLLLTHLNDGTQIKALDVTDVLNWYASLVKKGKINILQFAVVKMIRLDKIDLLVDFLFKTQRHGDQTYPFYEEKIVGSAGGEENLLQYCVTYASAHSNWQLLSIVLSQEVSNGSGSCRVADLVWPSHFGTSFTFFVYTLGRAARCGNTDVVCGILDLPDSELEVFTYFSKNPADGKTEACYYALANVTQENFPDCEGAIRQYLTPAHCTP